jgi:alkylation response protein AidB-like acyl-CoA dehydrogenase
VRTEEEIRSEVRAWLADAWDPALTVRAWWSRLADSGFGFPHWPADWFGRSMNVRQAAVVREELAAARVLGPPIAVGTSMGAPVLLAHGSDEQRGRWLSALARGEEAWCQFFSEPGAGSDLAAVRTRAVRDGNEWVVEGQKVWNSATVLADRGILVARTDPDVPKHRGMSFFVIDVDQPGLEVRPIRQMNGRSEFNETFFTGARVGDDAMIGAPGDGWRVAMTTLSNERADFAGGWEHPLAIVPAGEKAGHLDKIVGDLLEDPDRDEIGEANTPPIHNPEGVVALARECARAHDPVIRERMARAYSMSEALRWTAERAAAAAAAGRQPGVESSIGYVGSVRLLRLIRDLVGEIAGPAGLLTGPDGSAGGDVAMTIVTVPCHGIQGGSEQIQMNILGERVLGLPKEPQVDRDTPFRDIVTDATPRRA